MRRSPTGWPLEAVRKAHEAAVAEHNVWGVPTFVVGDDAVFVRLMEAPDGDPATSVRTVERVDRADHRLAAAQRVQAHPGPSLTTRTMSAWPERCATPTT
jgi:hypothetical protein